MISHFLFAPVFMYYGLPLIRVGAWSRGLHLQGSVCIYFVYLQVDQGMTTTKCSWSSAIINLIVVIFG